MTSLVNIVKMSKCFNYRFVISSRSIHVTQALNLYSQNALGIDGYLQSRKAVREQFSSLGDKFRSQMKEFITDAKNMIFTEDLKNMAFMAETVDIDLVLNMVKKYNNQNTKFKFGSYVLGPVVMRMFYYLDAPKEALQCYEDPENSPFFEQLTSYQILLDLLYNHGMYDDVYRVFERLQGKELNKTRFPKYPVILILASCYKQNTPKSMEYASNLWSEMISSGIVPLRRASALFAALALKQSAPHVALESISMQKPNYVTVRNIKAIALAELNRMEDTLVVLKRVLESDNQMKHTFFEETISKIRGYIEKSNSNCMQEFENIERLLRERGLVNNETLENMVLSEISIVNKKSEGPKTMWSTSKNHYDRDMKSKNIA